MSIIHNMSAMNAQRQYKITTGKRAKSAEKLASGYRINRSADDAAGLQISEKMRWQIRGLNKGQNNIMEGISWTQVGDGAMAEVSDMLHRMTELCVQAANDTNTEIDRQAIQAEINELQKEINRIGDSTEFNTQQVFQNEDVMMDIDGAAESMNIFNSSYDAATGKVTYGGFIFAGERVTWDKVDPAMVSTDATTGEQVFTEGIYNYTDANGNKFEIKCEAGAKVPELSRVISVTATSAGISVDGMIHTWDKLKDENGNSATNGVHGGVWTLEHNNSTIAFYMPKTVETIDDMVEEINSCSNSEYTYTLMESYSGPQEEQAVDATVGQNMIVTNAVAKDMTGNAVTFTVRADEVNGIWLEANGNKVTGSEKSWANLGITSWDSGNSISDTITYTYFDSDNDTTNDTKVQFSFTLSDVTSPHSVVDGLDGMVISGSNVITNYELKSDITLDNNILKLDVTNKGVLNFEDEKTLGRDFDVQMVDGVGGQNVAATYTAGSGDIALNYSGTNGAVTYTGTDTNPKAQMTDDINEFINYVLDLKKNAALAAQDPQQIKIGTVNLTEVVGEDNITTSGYFNKVITIDSTTMKDMTDGSSSFSPGADGQKYPSAYIDFQGLGTKYTLDSLRSAGFNSTCKTCTNHYSIIFTDVSSGSTTADGYKYNMQRDGNHYTLEIDIETLRQKGVNTGADLAKAIVDINKEVFDFHFTQYAAEGSVLHIYDNRMQASEAKEATFDTFPFEPLDIGTYKFDLAMDDGKEIDLEYTYNYKDIADKVIVEMQQDSAGEYVKITNGSCTYYEKYDSAIHGTVPDTDRYNMSITYKDTSGNEVDKDAMVKDYSEKAIEKMLTNTTTQWNATDYTTVSVSGDENPNVAIRSLFETDVDAPEYQKGINIQCSANEGDSVKIPRFALHTVALRLYRMNVMSHESASEAISNVEGALSKLSSMRSTYGAYQNRLEHTYASRGNMEENLQAAESRIRDTDMADEMVELSKHNILAQVGEAMMAQANQSKQGILNLLQ